MPWEGAACPLHDCGVRGLTSTYNLNSPCEVPKIISTTPSVRGRDRKQDEKENDNSKAEQSGAVRCGRK